VEWVYNFKCMMYVYDCDNKVHFMTPKYIFLQRRTALEIWMLRHKCGAVVQSCALDSKPAQVR
jgi:hypothetical protein